MANAAQALVSGVGWGQAFSDAMSELGQQVREAPRTLIRGTSAAAGRGGAIQTKHRVSAHQARLHSVVMACRQYYMRNIVAPPLRGVAKDKKPLRGSTRIAVEELNYRLEQAFTPRDDFNTGVGSFFWQAHALGDGFLWRDRKANGVVRAYWWIPYHHVLVWQGEYLGEVSYQYLGDRLDSDTIVHLRNFESEDNLARGVGALHTLVGEVYIDEQARRYAAALLANDGRPNGIMAIGGNSSAFERERAAEMLMEKHGGDNVGKIAVVDNADGVDFQRINMTPNEFDFSALVKISETRIPGTLGIPSSQINMYTGLETGTTNATRREDREQVQVDLLMPQWESYARQMTRLIVPDWTDDPNVVLEFDTSRVAAVIKQRREREQAAHETWKNTGMNMYDYQMALGHEIEPENVEKFKRIWRIGEGKNARFVDPDSMIRECDQQGRESDTSQENGESMNGNDDDSGSDDSSDSGE